MMTQMTVWKFKYFTAILILCEIIFRGLKSAILTFLKALNFGSDEFIIFWWAEIDKNQYSGPQKLQK